MTNDLDGNLAEADVRGRWALNNLNRQLRYTLIGSRGSLQGFNGKLAKA